MLQNKLSPLQTWLDVSALDLFKCILSVCVCVCYSFRGTIPSILFIYFDWALGCRQHWISPGSGGKRSQAPFRGSGAKKKKVEHLLGFGNQLEIQSIGNCCEKTRHLMMRNSIYSKIILQFANRKDVLVGLLCFCFWPKSSDSAWYDQASSDSLAMHPCLKIPLNPSFPK